MFKAKLCEFKARLWKFNKNYWSQYFVTYGKRTVTEHSTDYIQNWSFEPFYQDYDIAFHTIYVGRVNFIYEWPFGFCPKDRIHGDYIYFQNFYKKSAERQLPKKYFFFIFRFVEYVGPGVWTVAWVLLRANIFKISNLLFLMNKTIFVISLPLILLLTIAI